MKYYYIFINIIPKMSHKFLPSIKKGVSYCSYCGCLSYKNIPSKKSHTSKNQRIMEIDPLILKYKPISLKIDFSLESHKNYMNGRNKGLSKIYYLSNNFKLGRMIKYKAIGLMDQIYLNNGDVSIENIEEISSTCVLLSIEFNDCYSNSNKIKIPINYDDPKTNQNKNNNIFYINNKKALYKYIRKEINSIMYWQAYCLKKLDYNLGKYTSFDYINLFSQLGIIFTKKEVDTINMLERCFNILDTIIGNQYFCKYSQYIVAMSVIYIIFKSNNYFNLKVFKYIYVVDFSKEKYKLCINAIYSLVTNLYKIKFKNNSFSNMNVNIIENNYYFKNYNVNIKNYFLYEKINNDFQLNPKLDINKELIFKYINIIESIKSNNYKNSTNKIQLFNSNCLYLSALKILQNNLIENNFINNNNCILKNLGLTTEDSEQKTQKNI